MTAVAGFIGVSVLWAIQSDDRLARVLFFLCCIQYPFIVYFSAKSERSKVRQIRSATVPQHFHSLAHELRSLYKQGRGAPGASSILCKCGEGIVEHMQTALNEMGLCVDHVCLKLYDQSAKKLYVIARSDRERYLDSDREGELAVQNPFFTALYSASSDYKKLLAKTDENQGNNVRVRKLYVSSTKPTFHLAMSTACHTARSDFFQEQATNGLRLLGHNNPVSSGGIATFIEERMRGNFQLGVCIMDKSSAEGGELERLTVKGFIGVDSRSGKIADLRKEHIELIAGLCDLLEYNLPVIVDYSDLKNHIRKPK